MFLEHSPRNLILRNFDDEALEIIQRINGENIENHLKQSICQFSKILFKQRNFY
jgi:hypothetical protein